jgi:hypothetical protein
VIELVRLVMGGGNRKRGVRSRSEFFATVAVLFVWLSVLSFVGYSILDKDSVFIYLMIPIAVGALLAAGSVGVLSFLVGQWERAARIHQKAELVAEKAPARQEEAVKQSLALNGVLYTSQYEPVTIPQRETDSIFSPRESNDTYGRDEYEDPASESDTGVRSDSGTSSKNK